MARRDLIDEVINSPKVDAQLDRLDERLEKVVKKIIEINRLGKTIDFSKGFTESARAAQEARAATEALRKEREELRKQEQATRNAIAESRLEQQKLKTEMDRTREAEQKARIAKKALKDSIVAETGSIIQLRNTLRQLQAQYDTLGPKARNAIGGREMLANIKRVDAELKKLEATTGRFQRNVGNYPKLVGGLQGFLGGAGIGATLGAAGVGLIAKQVFDVTLQLDSLNMALRAVSGSEEEFAKSQQFLLELSDRLGLSILGLTQNYKLFYASSTQAGLTSEQTRDIFNSVSEAAATLKLSQDDVNGVFTAFGQIASKGKVQAEELRGQIGERLPGAFAIAARAIGVSQAQLNKMLESGLVMAQDFLPKFAKELEKTFGIAGKENVEGLQAAVGRLDNEFTKLVSNNQSGLSKFFASIVNGAREALNGFNIFLERVQQFNLGEYLSELTIGSTGKMKDADEVANAARREQLARGNDAYIEAFRKASAKERQAMLEEARKMADLAAKEAERAAVPGFLTGANPTQLGQNAAAIAKSRRAQDYAFQESDRVQRLQQIIAAEAAAVNKATQTVTKEQEAAAARLRERQRKALLEAKGIDLQTAIDSQKEIFENEKVALQDRLDALANYYDLREQLITENLKGEKDKEKLLPEEVVLLEKKADAERIKNRKEFWKEYSGIAKSGADEQTKAVLEAQERETDVLERQESNELSRESERFQKGIYNEDQYELAKLQVANKYNVLRLQVEIDSARKILEIQKAAGLIVTDQVQRLNDLEKQLREENLKYYEDTEKQKTEISEREIKKREAFEAEFNGKIKELGTEALGFIRSMLDADVDREKNLIEDQIADIEKKNLAEIEAINRSSASEEEKAAKIQVLNARTQAQKEALERRQRELDQQKARFQRMYDIGTVIANTALAVTGALGNKPWGPQNIALAAVVGGIGLAQLGQIIARPIPRYAEGTDDHPGGWAQVGDGWRHEVVVNPDGSMQVTPNRPTYLDLQPHAMVFPSIEDFFVRNPHLLFQPPPAEHGGSSIIDPRLAENIVKGVDKSMRRVERAIVRQPRERVAYDRNTARRQYWDGNIWQTYINQYILDKK